MCGIAGVMTAADTREDALLRRVESMSACIRHRGPDDSGSWAEPRSGVAFGFRRLSIIDVSAAGHQPMASASGRFTIVFNGEVYNYVEIRQELERDGSGFRGHSDTEVILAAFERWGIAASVKRFIGMFAIAAWDAESRTLSLIRDRLGIKPVYYFHRPGLLTFGSELKALVGDPEFDRTIDESALTAYLRYLYVPAPLTIYRAARKLLPGHILTITDVVASLPEPVPYWSLDEVYRAGRAAPFEGSDEDAVDELRRLLSDAVRLRMRSDVPMGALLSGGIDSTTVVALMQANATQPTRTFSIGFPGTAHDEAADAARIAAALGTDHTEMSVTGDDALGVVPMLPDLFDEPFADPSQIPTYLVCRLARRDVTVALSGDGGDEVFAGYERYIQGERIIGALQRVPRAIRRVAGAGIRSSSAQFWDRAYRSVAPVIDRGGRHRLAGEKIRKLGNLLGGATESDMYRVLMSAAWQDPATRVSHEGAGSTRIEQLLARHRDLPLLDRMMLVDQQTYLADDLLAKVDRASMAVSLEARVPLLDHRVLELAWRFDRRLKVRDGRGKWALRQVLYGFVDPALVDRPKTGFSVPIGAWLRGPLRPWAEELLFGTVRGEDAWLSTERVRGAWLQLQRGGDEMALALWAAVMFQAWRARWAN
jgi:asparagine synthase (glutamine-hydrolysing)